MLDYKNFQHSSISKLYCSTAKQILWKIHYYHTTLEILLILNKKKKNNAMGKHEEQKYAYSMKKMCVKFV